MVSSPIHFLNEDVDCPVQNTTLLQDWVHKVIHSHNKIPGEITFIFCSDPYLHEINKQYLDHDTYTDIITFDYNENDMISGDIFISVDRVAENAEKFATGFKNELHRVMIHGVLHLIGFKDKTGEEKNTMTMNEDKALDMLTC